MHISPDARERHHYYDNAVSELRQGLQDPSVQSLLGELALVGLETVGDSYFLGYDEAGLSIPRRKQDTTGIPVTVLRPGERMHLDQTFASNNAIQINRMRERLQGWRPLGGTAQIESDLANIPNVWGAIGNTRSNHTVRTEKPPRGITAYRTAPVRFSEYQGLGKLDIRIMLGRPIVALIIDPQSQNKVKSRDLWHEFIHVRDDENRPLMSYDAAKLTDELGRMELRAYRYERAYAIGLHQSKTSRFAGNDNLLYGHSVEMLRRRLLRGRKDPFEPTGALKRALKEAELLDHIFMT